MSLDRPQSLFPLQWWAVVSVCGGVLAVRVTYCILRHLRGDYPSVARYSLLRHLRGLRYRPTLLFTNRLPVTVRLHRNSSSLWDITAKSGLCTLHGALQDFKLNYFKLWIQYFIHDFDLKCFCNLQLRFWFQILLSISLMIFKCFVFKSESVFVSKDSFSNSHNATHPGFDWICKLSDLNWWCFKNVWYFG